MELGIRRRGVLLTPPLGRAEAAWVLRAGQRADIARAFGHDSDARPSPPADLGIVRIDGGRRAVGYALLYPPTRRCPCPEVAYALVDRGARDGFTAICAADGWSYHLFEVLGLRRVILRTAADNLAAWAVLRRLGYADGARFVRVGGRRFGFRVLERRDWRRRLGRLVSREAEAPFTRLRWPPESLLVGRDDLGADAPAHEEVAHHRHATRVAGFDEVAEDAVGDRLVKGALVPIRP